MPGRAAMAQEFSWLVAFPLQRARATLEGRLGIVQGHTWVTFKLQVTPRGGMLRARNLRPDPALLRVHVLTMGDADEVKGRKWGGNWAFWACAS